MDPWVGYKWRHLLPSILTDKLHSVRIYFLKDIGCPGVYFLMERQWLSGDNIGLVDNEEITCWNGYLAILKANHVMLSNEDDVMVWNQSKSCKYTPKYGYLHLIMDRNEVEISWWWK